MAQCLHVEIGNWRQSCAEAWNLSTATACPESRPLDAVFGSSALALCLPMTAASTSDRIESDLRGAYFGCGPSVVSFWVRACVKSGVMLKAVMSLLASWKLNQEKDSQSFQVFTSCKLRVAQACPNHTCRFSDSSPAASICQDLRKVSGQRLEALR